MNSIKELVFQESNNLDEALKYKQCQSLYSRLKQEQSVESAKQETLKLYNEARWLACQEILDFYAFVSGKPPYIEVFDSFTEADVRALAKQLSTRVPTNRFWFDHGPRELFPVTYKAYDEWGEDCQYTPYNITKGYTDDLLVELLYESTKTDEGKSKLLNNIIERAGLYDDREQLPGWHWALSKRELTKHRKSPQTFEETLSKLHDANIGFSKSKENALKKYLEFFVKAGYIIFNENQKVYVINKNKKIDGHKLHNYHIAFWLEKVMCKILKIEYNNKTPWKQISPLILKSNFEIYDNLKRDLSNYRKHGQDKYLEKELLGGLDEESLFPEIPF